MGRTVLQGRIQADGRKQLVDPALILLAGFRQMMNPNGLAHHIAGSLPRIKGAVRILEDKLNLSPQFTQMAFLQGGNVLSLEDDFSTGGVVQAKQRFGQGGFAAARLAHQAEGFTLANGKADVIQRLHIANLSARNSFGDGEVLAQLANLQKGLIGHRMRMGLFQRKAAMKLLAAEPACSPVRVRINLRRWHDGLPAPVNGVGAARREGTAAGLLRRVQRRARNGQQPGGFVAVQPGDRPQKPHGIWMAGMIEKLLAAALLGNVARVHDVYPLGVAGNDAQVVRDDDQRHVRLPDNIPQQVENLLLRGHIQGSSGLVGNQQLGVAGNGHGNHHALTHAPGKLVGIMVDPAFRIRDTHHAEQLDGSRPCLRFGIFQME